MTSMLDLEGGFEYDTFQWSFSLLVIFQAIGKE